MIRRAALAFALAAASLLAVPAFAEEGPAWHSLAPEQRKVLAPLERDWSTLPAARKSQWLEVARRFPTLPEARRQRIQERMTDWARMTPEQRAGARLRYSESRQLTPEERQQRWQAWQALPEDKKREYAAPRREPRAAPAAKAPGTAPVRPVGPALVQGPGATTTFVNPNPALAPGRQQSGVPKIATTDGFVDRETLLPQRGPQGAAIQPAPRDKRKPAKGAAPGGGPETAGGAKPGDATAAAK